MSYALPFFWVNIALDGKFFLINDKIKKITKIILFIIEC